MYLKNFHLEKEPFASTPDPHFLYRSPIHQEALERLMAAVTMRRGVNAITAEPGLGKTTLIRTLLEEFQDNIHFAWLFNTTLSSVDLLRYICRDFGLNPTGEDKSDVLMELYTFLIREYKKDKNCLIIIDEAQNLEPSVLEEIRLLSNLETANSKLVQIILSGQPQLDEHLDLPELVQLKQRISQKATLEHLDEEESKKYIQHRLNIAGGDETVFSDAALSSIHDIADGIPRLLNHVCENAMMLAAKRKMTEIDAVLIHELVERGLVIQAHNHDDSEESVEPVECESEKVEPGDQSKSDSEQNVEDVQKGDEEPDELLYEEEQTVEKSMPVETVDSTSAPKKRDDLFGFIDVGELTSVL